MTLSDFQSNNKLDSTQQVRLLRLLQWQLQHLLSFESVGELAETARTIESEAFEVKIRSPIPIEQMTEQTIEQVSHLKSGVLIQRNSGRETTADSSVVWILDIVEGPIDRDCARLYAQVNISDYWLLDLNKVELHLYQQPSQLGYVSYRVLQVGDRATPDAVPINVVLQEPTPLHFMIRTLHGQQTYKSYTLPFAFSRKLL